MNRMIYSLVCCLISLCPLLGPLLADSFPIDVVYTWVNGQDEEWQKLRDTWANRENPRAPKKASDAVAPKRFRDREELRYSLRALRAFMPYVHHIYIVTCGQKPSWIQEDPQITFVDHKDIFQNLTALPTFNSMAIEANLHRIPGLAEHYVYFNDDVFLMRMTDAKSFFTSDGKLRVFFGTHKLPSGKVSSDNNGYIAACKNTANVLNEFYGRKTRMTHAHTPFPSIKEVSMKAEAVFPTVFKRVTFHRFRSREGFAITNGIIPYVALYAGMGKESHFSSKTWMFGESAKKDRRTFAILRKNPPQFLCMQDSLKNDADAAKVDRRLRRYLSFFFPEKAPWEKN